MIKIKTKYILKIYNVIWKAEILTNNIKQV